MNDGCTIGLFRHHDVDRVFLIGLDLKLLRYHFSRGQQGIAIDLDTLSLDKGNVSVVSVFFRIECHSE